MTQRTALGKIGVTTSIMLWSITPAGQGQTRIEFTPQRIQIKGGETIEADFGRIEVPENRGKKDSRKISLAVLRIPSPLENPGPPVFMLAGGPGGSSIEMVKRQMAGGGRTHLELMRGDLVAIDQRGVGQSRPNLESSTLYGLPLDQPGDPATMLEVIRKCCREEAKRWRDQGVDLAGYTTVESADDIEAVRVALGYGKIVLWGESYGSHLALATLRRHEPNIDRLVLIGPEGPDHTLKLPSYAQESLKLVAGLAKADATVAGKIPDLLKLVKSVLDQLEKTPVYVDVGGTRVGISQFDVQSLLADKLSRTRRGIDQIPAVVKSMAEGDFKGVGREVMEFRQNDGIPSAMQMVMDSASGVSRERATKIAAEAKDCLLGDVANFPFPHVAEAWGAPDLGDDFRGPLSSKVPVLMVVGDLDPRTPLREARELMKLLSNSHLIVVKNVSHDVPWGVRDIAKGWSDFLAGRKVSVTQVEGPKMQFEPL